MPSDSEAPRTLEVEVWSDIVCPWCYVGNVRFKKAVAELGDDVQVNLRTRSFELDQNAPHDPQPNLERLAEKYMVELEQAREMENRLAAVCAEENVPFAIERVTANSFDLHRLVHLAREFGRGEELFDELQREHFGEGINVFEHDHLIARAVDFDLPADRVEALLAGDELGQQVRDDEREAQRIGVSGVPFTVLDGRLAIPGAVAVDQYVHAIELALQENN